jgi:hypothetical protein
MKVGDPSFLEALGNGCMERLVVLFCERGRLNGLGHPIGFETSTDLWLLLLAFVG